MASRNQLPRPPPLCDTPAHPHIVNKPELPDLVNPNLRLTVPAKPRPAGVPLHPSRLSRRPRPHPPPRNTLRGSPVQRSASSDTSPRDRAKRIFTSCIASWNAAMARTIGNTCGTSCSVAVRIVIVNSPARISPHRLRLNHRVREVEGRVQTAEGSQDDTSRSLPLLSAAVSSDGFIFALFIALKPPFRQPLPMCTVSNPCPHHDLSITPSPFHLPTRPGGGFVSSCMVAQTFLSVSILSSILHDPR